MRKALITGATSGIGYALAHFLLSKGYTLILTGRNEEKLKEFKTARTLALDLANQAQRQELIALIHTELPELIINNAGFGLYGPTSDLSTQEQLDMVEVNVKAPMEIAIESAKALLKTGRKGTILNIASAAGFFSYPHFNTYAATKTYLINFSLALDAELKNQGIRVLCSCPGPVATDFRNRAAKGGGIRESRIGLEKAVGILWNQIEGQKPLVIFDWRTHLLVMLAKILPRWLRDRALKRSINAVSRDT